MKQIEFEKIFTENFNNFGFDKKNKDFIFNLFIKNFEIAYDGFPTYKKDGKYLYSKYKPSEKFKNLDFQKKDKIVIVENGIGFSLYYLQNKFNKIFLKDNFSLLIIYTSFDSFLASLFIVNYFDIPVNKYSILLDNFYNNFTKKNILNFLDNKVNLHIFDNLHDFERIIEEYFFNNIRLIDDFDKFKLHFENSSININTNNNAYLTRIFNLVKIINDIGVKHFNSISTEKFFNKIWKRNIQKNLKIIEQRGWNIEDCRFNAGLNNKKGLILWGASPLIDQFLSRLNSNEIKIINEQFISIAITSSVSILEEKNIIIDYQTIFDAGFFTYFNVENFSIPFLCSMILNPAIMKRLKSKPFLVNLQTEEEKLYEKLNILPSFPFYGATIPTIINKFHDKIRIYVVGSGFDSYERITHHKRYPLYNYIISKSILLNPLLKWETIQKIYNIKKFEIYKNSLNKFSILREKDLFEELKNNLL